MPSFSQEEMLKHAVRREIWLPACLRRLEAIRHEFGAEAFLRYFTYSSGDALDPIFLYIADVLEARAESGPEGSQGLTTVHFFNRNADNPQPVMNDLPGARCFGGPFIETVLFDPNAPQPVDPDSDAANKHGLLKASHKRFHQYFPFDIINFDWNDLLLDGSPAVVVDALKQVFDWQSSGGDQTRAISGFTLSISLRKPLPNELSGADSDTIRTVILVNMRGQPRLATILRNRCGASNVDALANDHWDDFIELGIPKIIITTLNDTGWAIDPAHPLRQVVRPATGSTHSIQQLIIEVVKKTGPMSTAMYGQSVESLFAQQPDVAHLSNSSEVQMSLSDVYTRRDMFRDGPPQI